MKGLSMLLDRLRYTKALQWCQHSWKRSLLLGWPWLSGNKADAVDCRMLRMGKLRLWSRRGPGTSQHPA